MGMEHWWNDTDRGKLKYWERNPVHCHFVHHKFNMDWRWGPLRNHPKCCVAWSLKLKQIY